MRDLNRSASSQSIPTLFLVMGGIIAVGLVLLGFFALILVFNTHPAAAQDGSDTFKLPPGVTWDDVNAVARNMYCDVCEGIPLDECESVACQQWREEIARQLGEGRTKDEIIDYFTQRYGSDVAAIPRNRNDRTLAYAVPIGVGLLIGIAGMVQVRRLRQHGQPAGQASRRLAGHLQTRPVPEDLDPALLERLERDLERLD